jgi:hypothetical protein
MTLFLREEEQRLLIPHALFRFPLYQPARAHTCGLCLPVRSTYFPRGVRY